MGIANHPDVRRARQIAIGLHHGQRGPDGAPVLARLAATADALRDFADPVKSCAAWLRLALREPRVSTTDLLTWGVRPAVRPILVRLTPRTSEDETAHLARLVEDRDAALVELAARLVTAPGPREMTEDEKTLARAAGVGSRVVTSRAGF